MMKHYITILVGLFFCISTTFAYIPTEKDQQTVEQVTEKMVEITDEDPLRLRNFMNQLEKLAHIYNLHEKLYYLLSTINENLKTTFAEWKSEAKTEAFDYKKDFLMQYKTGVVSRDEELHQGCTEYYDILDDLAFAYDHPTSLLIAIRHRESTCGFYLPHNTRGPFQIISKNYGTGDISLALFEQTVEDYLQFSDHKHAMYERANAKSGYTVDLSYTGWTFTGVVYHSSLYNGLSGANIRGSIAPGIPEYVYDNYTRAYSGATRDGIIATMIKVIDREIQKKQQEKQVGFQQ